MSYRLHSVSVLFFFLVSIPAMFAGDRSTMVILPDDEAAYPSQSRRLIWSTEPGLRYELQESVDLENWTVIDGFPTEAEALAQQRIIELQEEGPKRFYRVRTLDEQPPEIISRVPRDGAFGVRRFSKITVQLQDASEIDPASISLNVGVHGTFTLTEKELSFEDNFLTFDLGGDIALGSWGDVILASLTVADVHGNSEVYDWGFQLERKAQIAGNIFIFGSPVAQRSGQRLNESAAALAASFGDSPVRMSGTGGEWEIESVSCNQIVISYAGEPPASFQAGQYITNLSPSHSEEIFYRRVDSVIDNTIDQKLILQTSEAALGDFIINGAFSVSENAALLQKDEFGNLMPAIDFGAELQLPPLGADFSEQFLFDEEFFSLFAEKGALWFDSRLLTSLDITDGVVERFKAQLIGGLEFDLDTHIVIGESLVQDYNLHILNSSNYVMFVVEEIPVWIEIKTGIQARAKVDVEAATDLSGGFSYDGDLGVIGQYIRDSQPSVIWHRWFTNNRFELLPCAEEAEGGGKIDLSFLTEVDIRVHESAGMSLSIDPLMQMGSLAEGGSQQGGPEWFFRAYGVVEGGLDITGPDNFPLTSLPSFGLYEYNWGALTGGDPVPLITSHPVSQVSKLGDTAVFSVDARALGGLSYQWYHGGVMIPGQTGREMAVPSLRLGHQGRYHVKVSAGGFSIDSRPAFLYVVDSGRTGSRPDSGLFSNPDMVLIPAGINSGVDPDFGYYNLVVDSFYIDKYPVVKDMWDEVYGWALDHSYSFPPYSGRLPGEAKAANHPLQYTSWYDAVKWCNARSEKDGRVPVYYTDPDLTQVFRTGSGSENIPISVFIDHAANGYRLPSNTQWEYAARGGLIGNRFPWGDKISFDHANYRTSIHYSPSYDLSREENSHHPVYGHGNWYLIGNTSPAGAFTANN